MARYLTTDEQRAAMVTEQLRNRGISDPRVLAAMNRIPRERFIPEDGQVCAYSDQALAIACDQTISQPYIVALMSEALELTGTEHVLEVGTGSGYQAAILGELADSVVSIERHPKLAREAGEVLAALGYRNVRVVEGDGTLGWPDEAPFDRIIITAATDAVPPALWQQLKEGGLLVAPLGNRDWQVLQAIRKTSGSPQPRDLCTCRFVPLMVDSPAC